MPCRTHYAGLINEQSVLHLIHSGLVYCSKRHEAERSRNTAQILPLGEYVTWFHARFQYCGNW